MFIQIIISKAGQSSMMPKKVLASSKSPQKLVEKRAKTAEELDLEELQRQLDLAVENH